VLFCLNTFNFKDFGLSAKVVIKNSLPRAVKFYKTFLVYKINFNTLVLFS